MKLTKEYLEQLISEEIQNERFSIIYEKESLRIKSLHESMERRKLEEGFFKDIAHTALDLGGLIPGFGEAADITNAALYAAEGDFLMAALSVVSMIPVVGDFIGKGSKVLRKFKPGWFAQQLQKHLPEIKKLLGKLADNPKIGKFADDMIKAVDDFVVNAISNPRSKEAIDGLAQMAQTKPVKPLSGGKLDKLKQLGSKAMQAKEKGDQRKRVATAIRGDQDQEGDDQELPAAAQ